MSEDMTEDPFPSEDASEESYDVCECVYSKLAMQRLLSFLREAQNQCTDTECFSTAPRWTRSTSTSSDFYTLALVIGFLTLMYLFRPSSLRHSRGDRKDRETRPGPSREPPPTVD